MIYQLQISVKTEIQKCLPYIDLKIKTNAFLARFALNAVLGHVATLDLTSY